MDQMSEEARRRLPSDPASTALLTQALAERDAAVARVAELEAAIGDPEEAERMRVRHNRDHCYVGNHEWMQGFVRRVLGAVAERSNE